jgi:thiosulfate/3-mercaptopyruvate sulfurtransferase
MQKNKPARSLPPAVSGARLSTIDALAQLIRIIFRGILTMRLFSVKRRHFLGLGLVASAALATVGPAQARGTAVNAAAVKFDSDWIVLPQAASELIAGGALVLDARGKDLKSKQGLVPNAVPVVWQDLSQPDLPTKGQLLDDDAVLSKKLQALGVSKNQAIVVLGDPANGWGEDGRIAWTLRTLGHSKVVMVDGGLPALQQLGHPAVLPAKIPGDFVVTRSKQFEIRKEELKDRLGKTGTVIFDVREPREYEGKTPYGESRGGHLPGAKALWFKELIGKDGRLLPRPEIEKLLASQGVTKDTEVVSYCTGGIRSGWFTVLLSDLGYKAKNYTGSIWEWSAAPPDQYPLVKN